MNETRQPITIVLVDDHPIIRNGLKALLETQPDFQVAGESSDGLDALRVIEQINPDIVVADITMPGLNGLDMTREIGKRSPQTKVIVLSMHTNEAFVGEALRNGARAYIVKDSTLTDLVQAVREVVAGRHFLSPVISQQVITQYIDFGKDQPIQAYATLTPREREVFQLVAEGHTNNEIGKRLFISPRTVEIHRASMMKKLGLKNHIELVAYAVKRGIIQV